MINDGKMKTLPCSYFNQAIQALQEEILSTFKPGLRPRSRSFPPLTLQFLVLSRMCSAASGFRVLAHSVPSVQDTFPLCDYLPNSYTYFETQTKCLSCLDCSLSGLPQALGCKVSSHLQCLTPVEFHVVLLQRR